MNALYFVETSSPRIGKWFLETDRDSNSREFAIQEMRRGFAVKVLEVCEDEGTCRDVTEDIREEAEQHRTFNRPDKLDAINAAWDHARKLRAEA